jgi:hypothetical protein
VTFVPCLYAALLPGGHPTVGDEDVVEPEVMGSLRIAHWRRKNAHGLVLALHITITFVYDHLHIGWVWQVARSFKNRADKMPSPNSAVMEKAGI